MSMSKKVKENMRNPILATKFKIYGQNLQNRALVHSELEVGRHLSKTTQYNELVLDMLCLLKL